MLNPNQFIKLPSDTKPQLVVVIDTEEEFDWSKKPQSTSTAVTAMSEIYRVQEIFKEYGIVPCYVVDHPIASNPSSVKSIKGYVDNNECEIGAHLHPWVNPPLVEELSFSNMYPGNLDKEIEFEKLKNLKNQIKSSFGITPTLYKAGRCGIGPNTAEILKELEFTIDVSVCAGFDYSADGGPDFSGSTSYPYWFGEGNESLEIPMTGGFVGMAGRFSRPLYNFSRYFDSVKATGILSNLSIVDRLMLSPEGYTREEHVKLTRSLIKKGLRTFTWNFHSPSVMPGMTEYTQTEKQVKEFLDLFRYYFDFFFEELGGEATTPTNLKKYLETLK
jgi:hypothetical protein